MTGDTGDRIRTALVTGGTGGMGRVIAATLAADGFDVAVAYAGSVDLADATVKEIAGHGRRGAAFAADVADADSPTAGSRSGATARSGWRSSPATTPTASPASG